MPGNCAVDKAVQATPGKHPETPAAATFYR
jgi:hypothetical protein